MKKIIDIIKGFFSKNLVWKLFSLGAAIILWFFVMNVINPSETKTFSVNLSVMNEDSLMDENLALVNYKELENIKVDLKIQATRPALDELSKPENKNRIKCYVDLQKVSVSSDATYPIDYTLMVTPSLPSDLILYNYDIVSYTPSTVEAKVDVLKSDVFDITVEYDGTPKTGYSAKKPTFDVEGVQVSGPESTFDEIATVKAIVDVTDASADVTEVVEPFVCDAEGNVLSGFVIEPKNVTVTVGVNKQGQVPVNEPKLVGELSDELILKSVEYTPKSIEVEGDAQGLLAIESITLPDIDLATITATETRTFDIRPYLDNTNLQLKSGSPTAISVTITVDAKASKDIQIGANKIKLIGLSEDLRAQVPATVSISVFGEESALDGVTAENVQASIDFTGLGEGWHNVELTLTLPEGVELRSKPTVYVMLKTKTEENENVEITTEMTTVHTTEAVQEPETKAEDDVEVSSGVE